MSAASPSHLQKSVLARGNYKVLYRGVIMARVRARIKKDPRQDRGNGRPRGIAPACRGR